MKIQGLQKLDWYIIRKFLVTFFVSIAFLSVIIVIFDISEKIEDFVRKEAPMRAIIFDYYVNWVPYFINMYSPMFVFLTVMFSSPCCPSRSACGYFRGPMPRASSLNKSTIPDTR